VTSEEQPPEGPQSGESGLERRIAGGLAFLRRRLTGDYEVDDFGYDEELTDQVLMSLLRPLYEKYFRVEVKGVENIPSEGGALIVANHSGTLPMDGLMMQPPTWCSCCRWSTSWPASSVTPWPAPRTRPGCWRRVSWSG
jgi:hypothetical protein